LLFKRLGLMTCLICGDICRCSSEADRLLAPQPLRDDGALAEIGAQHTLQIPTKELVGARAGEEAQAKQEGETSEPEGSSAWRQEVAARLNRYQARHKPRQPRYPSLRLRFEPETPSDSTSGEPIRTNPTAEPYSHQALALDRFSAGIGDAIEAPATPGPDADFCIDPGDPSCTLTSAPPAVQFKAHASAKIIEFPRSWTPPPPPLGELAEPVIDRPRILEAPEFVLPPPALGGITIEPAARPVAEKRPGIDTPLQSASLNRRIVAAALDDAIIGVACTLFGFIFWKMTAIRPPRIQVLVLAASLAGLFWATYQYLLLVYAGTTPGLRLAKLELARFDGTPAPRRLRRWRVIASFLSAASLGLGYLWAFLDEDLLCWHDRITHTHLAPRQPPAAS
jgi:uncharacterized RDD family membrane protein YckC